MPHVESPTTTTSATAITTDDNNMSKATTKDDTAMVNGERPSSKVLSHLQTYPLINDTLNLFQSHPYGAKSLSLAQQLYKNYVTPITPYLSTPYSYVSPYLHRVDDLTDNGLTRVDSTFPVLKQDTRKLKESVQSFAGLPWLVMGKGKDYVVGTFNDEYSKVGGKEGGVVRLAKAAVSAELRMGAEGFRVVSGYLGKGKERAGKKIDGVRN